MTGKPAHAVFRRLEHQGPTSDEVGMQESPRMQFSVGLSIKDPPLTRWVCRKAGARSFL